MKSNESIIVTVYKPYDYKPIPLKEKERVIQQVALKIIKVANRFDGPSQIKVHITGKGNA